MILSKKSWHYWIYKQFFKWTPTNLCPYFWKTVIAFIIFPVAFIFALPWALVTILINDPLENEDDKRLGRMAGLGFFTWFALWLLISMILMFFTKSSVTQAAGAVGWVITGTVIIGSFIDYMVRKSRTKPKRSTLVGEFIKAKKGKYCPKIDWVENENNKDSL